MNHGALSSERKIFLLTAVLFFNLVLVSTNVVLKDQRTLFHSIVGFIVSPFQIAFQKSIDYVSHEAKHYVFLKDSFSKYHDLKKKYSRLKYENYKLKEKLYRHQAQQRAIDNYKNKYAVFFTAETISIDRNFPLNNLMINKGSRDGIEKHMIVLNEDGDLVGKIAEPITLFSSKVQLITGSVGGVGAYVESNKLEGLLTGNNTNECSFKYLIANKPVFHGDKVITSGTDEIFPHNIPVGRVITAQKGYLTQKVNVKPYFIDKSVKRLVIIKKEDEKGSDVTYNAPLTPKKDATALKGDTTTNRENGSPQNQGN
ncbi:MAG: rod shape-determining protein MreC [bacterium]|nr:rod shape-determining protein MreC [bacterium]